MLRHLLLLLLVCATLVLQAQNERSHWYYGIQGTGIRFENGEPQVDNSPQIGSFIGSVSMSDSSGNLLFYSNGAAFFNKNHEAMEGSTGTTSAYSKDAIATPSTKEPGVYWTYTVNQGWIDQFRVDMTANGGLGRVNDIGKLFPSEGKFVETVTAIKACESNTYWLITAQNVADYAQMICYEVDQDGGLLSQTSTLLLDNDIANFPWEMVTSQDGEYIALISNIEAQLIRFDPKCGRFIEAETMKLPNTGGLPKGAYFSPSGQYLYVTQSQTPGAEEGYIYQVDYKNLTSPNTYDNFIQTNYSLYSLLIGPDDRLYVTTQNDKDRLRSIDRIENPDAPWTDIKYEVGAITYPALTVLIPFLPNFINDTRDCSKPEAPLPKSTDFCQGDSLFFTFKNTLGYDSIYLIDFDLGDSYSIDGVGKATLPPRPAGTYTYGISWRACERYPKEQDLEVTLHDYPILSVSDTTICMGDTVQLKANLPDHLYEYFFKQNGQWRPQVSHLYAKGNYKTTVSNGFCTSEDSFALDLIPPLTTSLGDSFSFCEQAGTSIVLDAGKGFEGYLWHPTEDSTQWITVRKKGDYYVVVNDSRGCKGRGDAKVFSDCQPLVFIPNAFSPDGNGINDSFYIKGSYIVPQTLQVFDRWGALLHYGKGPKTAWNGTKNGVLLPMGMYFYLMTYKEEFTGEAHTLSGPIYLLR